MTKNTKNNMQNMCKTSNRISGIPKNGNKKIKCIIWIKREIIQNVTKTCIGGNLNV